MVNDLVERGILQETTGKKKEPAIRVRRDNEHPQVILIYILIAQNPFFAIIRNDSCMNAIIDGGPVDGFGCPSRRAEPGMNAIGTVL